MIIDDRYFTYPQTYIAGIETRSDGKPAGKAPQIINDIQAYISKYEPRFLRMLLGKDIADNINDYPDIIPLLAQPDKGTSVIAKYVYFYYSRDNITINTISGQKLKKTNNSIITSPLNKLVDVWNDMVNECYDIIFYIDDYNLKPNLKSEIFEYINSFNL